MYIREETIKAVREKIAKWEGKIEVLEGILEKVSDGQRTIKFQTITGLHYLAMFGKREGILRMRKREIISIVKYRHEDSTMDMTFQVFEKYMPILTEIRDHYKKKNLKAPIIELI